MNIIEILKTARSYIWVYLKPVVSIFTSKAGKALMEIASEFVAKAASDPSFVTGDADKRRQWVADQIKAKNLETGYGWADSAINLAIELAVQKLKAEKK